MINVGDKPITIFGITLDFPNYFTIFGLPIYYYALCICAGVVLAYIYCNKRAPQFGIKKDDLLDGLIFGVPIGIIGARLWYCLFAPAGEITSLADVVNTRKGGLAIYGTVFFVGIFTIFFCRFKKIRLGNVLDLVSFGFIIGQMVGRLGNFCNREVYGVATALPWGMQVGNNQVMVHPLFLYEILWNLIGFLAMHFISKKWRKFPGQIALIYLAWYGLGRGWMEGLRDNKYIETLGNLPIHQIVGFTVFAVATFVLIVKLLEVKKLGAVSFDYVDPKAKEESEEPVSDYTPMYGEAAKDANDADAPEVEEQQPEQNEIAGIEQDEPEQAAEEQNGNAD